MRKSGMLVISTCIFFLALNLSFNVSWAAKNSFNLTVEKNFVSLDATNASSLDILEDLEKKAGIQVKIFAGVKDFRVTLKVERIPLYAIDSLLAKMGMKNVGMVYDMKPSKMALYVLPAGKDLRQYTKGKAVISQASFRSGTTRTEIKGKKIVSQTIGKNNVHVRYVKDEILLKFYKGVKQDEINNLLKRYNLAKVSGDGLSKIGYVKVRTTDSKDIQEVIKSLRKEYVLKNSEPNYLASALTVTDPLYPQQWYIPDTKFDLAWGKLKNKTHEKVAVVDSGIERSHPDFVGKIGTGHDFVNNDEDPADDHGHGTFVSGIIAAAGNTIGIKGLYEYAQILPVKVIDQYGIGTYDDVARGIIFAADQGARVINLSIGGYAFSYLLQDAIDYALEKGCILVAAGGNDGIEQKVYPSAYPDVIGVSALDNTRKIWGLSNSGSHIDICAPGVDVVSTGMHGGYIYASGTSTSTPMVSALAAMLCSEKPDLSCSYVKRLINQTSMDFGEQGYDKIYGSGEINAINAIGNDVQPFHDVAVESINIEPTVLKEKNPTYISVCLKNNGSFSLEKVVLRIYVNDALIDKTQEFQIEDRLTVVVPWGIAPSDDKNLFIKVVVQGKDDADESNNAKTKALRCEKEDGGLYTLHHIDPGVHQWIAGEAFWEWPNETSHEIFNYIGNPICDDVFDGNDSNNYCENLYAIIKGARDEDTSTNPFGDSDSDYSDDHTSLRHFWSFRKGWSIGGFSSPLLKDPDSSRSRGEPYDSAVNRAYKYWTGGDDLDGNYDEHWDDGGGEKGHGVLWYYQNGNKARAYEYLGHIVHLLTDMSSPAHTHNDAHGGEIYNGGDDSYEDFMKEIESNKYNFKRWGDHGSNAVNGTVPDYTSYKGSGIESGLYKIFYDMADKGADYESDDSPGEIHDDGIGDVGYEECILHQNELQPYVIKQVAALYKWFWSQTHEVMLATSPSPGDGASGVSINTDLTWLNGGEATSYNVYFGTDSSPDSGEYKGNQSALTYDPGTLIPDTTYYWRIDSVSSIGTTTGTVWSFTTTGTGQLTAPIYLSPANGATNVSTNPTLSWRNGGGATEYKVFTAEHSTGLHDRGHTTSTIYTATGLSDNTTYYWRIEAWDADGNIVSGPVWSFKTSPNNLPNLEISSFYVEYDETDTKLSQSKTFMNPGQTYDIDVRLVSRGTSCTYGMDPDKDTVETDVHYQIARSEDELVNWSGVARWGREHTEKDTLTKDNPQKEIFQNFTVPSTAAGKRIYFTAHVDPTLEVTETNENDNWWDPEWYPVQGSCDLTISYARLTNGRSSLTLGDRYGLEMAVRNLGPDGHPMDIRSAYYIKRPGSEAWQYVADDGTDAHLLVPGQDNPELTLNEPFTADLVGTYEVMVCADYQNAANETDENNNCTTFSFRVCPNDSPVASFTASPASGVAPLNVSFTNTSTGTISSWLWDFGDGSSSPAQSPTHTYSSAGTYTVTLRAFGPCESDFKSGTITVSTPVVANFTASRTSGAAPLNVSFTDTSTGAISSWSWTFGDGGTSSLRNPTHTFTNPGTYQVVLTVTGASGSSSKNMTISVYAPVFSSFTASPTRGVAPLSVSFTDRSTGPITSWSWNFGDGGTSSLRNPSHTYTAAGTYSVSLEVRSANLMSIGTGTITVVEPIIADFTASPVTGSSPLSVNFADRSTGAITSWLWNFGDGTSTSGIQRPIHAYSNPGTYSVGLTVSGPDGTDTETKTNLVAVTIGKCECDLNQDARCDMRDWLLFGRRWGSTACSSANVICECDLNHDGRCDMRDWLLFGRNWGQTTCPRVAWSMFRNDRQHTGRSIFVGSQTNSIKWAVRIGTNITSSPAIGADGSVYIGSNDFKIYALDGTTGSTKWSFTTGGSISSSPAIGIDGTVFVGSNDCKVYALDWATGKQKWAFTTTSPVSDRSPSVGVDGTVYIGSGKYVYALDGATGRQKWAFDVGNAVGCPSIGIDGTVYIGSSAHTNYYIYAINGVTGIPKWIFATGSWVEGSSAIGDDGTVYMGCDDGKVYALDGATGAIKWSYVSGGMIFSTPAIGADGTVYVGSLDNNVYALDGKTGCEKWVFDTGDMVSSSPAIGADNTVYIGSWNCNFYAIDGATGNQKWMSTTDGWTSPAIGADGTVYVGGPGGSVVAIGE